MKTQLVLAASFLVLIPFQNALAESRTVSVAGECRKEIVPDRSSIQITAEAQENEVSRAAEKASAQYEKVKSAVAAKDLKDVEFKTVEYNVSEVREWTNEKYVSRGFKARMGLLITTSDIKRLGEVIAIAARENVRDVGTLETFVSDELRARTEEACLADAVKDAQQKARKMADAASSRIGAAISIREEGVPPPQPLMAMPMMRAKVAENADMAPPSVEAGKTRIQVRVVGTFELK